MTNSNIILLVDTLMGLLSREMDIPPADWSNECLARSRRAWHRFLALEDLDPRASLCAGVEGEIFEALSVGRSARDVVSFLREFFEGNDVMLSGWGCPYCVDADGDPVPLSFGGSDWVCPACGCHTVSPVDDACVRLDDDGDGVM